MVLASILALTSTAQAYQIRTPASEPCHENITLGALGAIGAPWSSPQAPDVSQALNVLLDKLDAVPNDQRTRAFIEDVAKRYNFQDTDLKRRYLLASFVAGVREPDTRGLSVVRFNNARETHLANETQAPHSLRRDFEDGDQGNAQALENIQDGMLERFELANERWQNGRLNRRIRWTMPHYGEIQPQVYSPAFDLGEMVHTLQDSYTHILRHTDFSVLSVGNFIEAQDGTLDEARDGLGHSERMDQCNMDDEFDAGRVERARQTTARWIIDTVAAFEDPAAEAQLRATLADVYLYRPGCNKSNDYCGTPWLKFARQDITQPIQLWFCTLPREALPARSTGLGFLTALALLTGAIWLRRRSKRA